MSEQSRSSSTHHFPCLLRLIEETHNGSVARVQIEPMHLVRQLNSTEFRSNLRTMEFLKFLFSISTRCEQHQHQNDEVF